MSHIETVAVLLVLINIVLVVRRSLWNYPFGLAMVTLYTFLFFGEKLYSDTLLQIFFFIVQLYGWWNWLRGRDSGGAVIVRRRGARAMSLWIAGILMATALWGWLMHRYTDAAFPWWDASVAMTSIAAQILLSQRYIENWPLWVLTDALAIGLYHAKGLELTAGLYGVFMLVSLWGWREWVVARRAYAEPTQPA